MKRTIFCLILSAATGIINAATVSIDDARNKAAQLVSTHISLLSTDDGVTHQPELAYTKTINDATIYYVFNYPQGGFAIIGGDDHANEILGYSTNGTFSIDNIPDGLKDMLSMYSTQISYAINHPAPASAKGATKSARPAIAPMLKTHWGQDEPYNNAIPSLGEQYGHFVTGCNATATAQIMRYYAYPKNGYGKESYTLHFTIPNGKKIDMSMEADFGKTTYDWNNMLDDYSFGSYSDTQAEAVATLMYHLGVGMKMSYNQSSSSSEVTAPGKTITTNFGYSKNTRIEQRKYYSDSNWEDMIYGELQKGHPVLYGGNDANTGGGHAFVCHGYDEAQGGYLINWGWHGYCDGYFSLTGTGALTPDGTGIGGSAEGSSYTSNQSAYIGLVPDPEGKSTYQPHIAIDFPIEYMTGKQQLTLDRKKEKNRVVELANVGFSNVGYSNSDFLYGLMFEEQTTGKVYYTHQNTANIELQENHFYSSNYFALSFNTSSIPYNGTYTIRPVVRNNSDGSEWQPAYLSPAQSLPVFTVVNGTEAPTDIDTMPAADNANGTFRKFITPSGRIVIQKGGRHYTATGMEVKD